jgi:hypothetical protein
MEKKSDIEADESKGKVFFEALWRETVHSRTHIVAGLSTSLNF